MTVRASLERAVAPGYSTCLCCQRPWKFVEEHSTRYDETRGCFPLCEGCWRLLGTPDARLPYYRRMWEDWLGGLAHYQPSDREQVARRLLDDWAKIEAAVIAEDNA